MQRRGSHDDRYKLNRFFFKENAWYVEIRDGIKGPFPRREDASQFLARYVHDKRVQATNDDDNNPLSQEIV